jgi:hypothetical protein
MTHPALRVADVFRQHFGEYDRTHSIAPHQRDAVRHLLACRTAALGGHLYHCEACGKEVPLYNGCLDRHCPTCQTLAKEEWLAARRAELLPVEYFHAVFTVPHRLNPLIDANRLRLLGELFAAVAWVLSRFAADPQWRLEGQLGFFCVLHTWTQKLQEHFHLHVVVPGGVWRTDARQWVPCRQGFLFGKDALAAAFRNRYLKRLAALRQRNQLVFTGGAADLATPESWEAFLGELGALGWVVEPRPTAAGAEQALDYLGRYVHKVAIGNHRLLSLAHGSVRFSWRDRAHGNVLKTAELTAADFMTRFLYHILPPGFQKIRYYGWLAARNKASTLAAIRASLGVQPPPPPPEEPVPERILRLTGVDVRCCPACKASSLVYLRRLDPNPTRGPP